MFVNVPDPIMEFNADIHSTFASLPCTAYFLWLKWSVYELQDSFHRGGTISDITDQICSLNASLHSYDSPTQLVVDKYMKDHGLEVEPDEEEFGFGKLLIDYKPPKTSTAKISNKGKIFEFSVLVMALYSKSRSICSLPPPPPPKYMGYICTCDPKGNHKINRISILAILYK